MFNNLVIFTLNKILTVNYNFWMREKIVNRGDMERKKKEL